MKKNLLKSLLLTLMVLVGGSAWAGDKTVVKYSFDDATSPELTAGSRVSFDYSKTSVITSTKFLNAYNNTNGDPGASTLSLGSTDLSGETWTLSFEWAACGGCNSKPDHTTLKAGDTNLFDLSGNSNWNTTVTLSYTGSDGTKTLPVPECNKSYRFTAAVGNQFNTTDYWHHIVVTGSASGVKLTITNSSTGTAVVEDVVLSETNVSPTSLILEPCCGGGIGIDELSLTYYVEGDVIQTPVANYTAVNGIERTITATCETEGATLYYSTDGENWTEGASVTVSASGNVYFKAVKGTSESDVLTFAAEAGEAITLNAPAIVRSDNTTVTITADQAKLLLSPTATIKYTYDDENGEFTGSKTLKVAADATITAYAEATGYTTSATSERAVALFPTYIKTTENTPTKTSGNTTIALSTDIINVSGREYAAVLLDDVQWGTNVYLQNLTLADPIVWGIRNGNWYVNTLEPQWILVRNLKAGDIVVLDITYAASDMVNATYSEKYSFGNKHAYIVTADGDAEFAVKKPSATEMDYLYGVYAYTAMSEAEIALIQAKDAFQADINAAKAIDTTDKQGVDALSTAITAAETALAAADATVESIAAAKADLAKAVNAFKGANYDFASWIANPTFAGTPIDNNICTYAKDMAANNTTYSQMQPVNGWNFGVENGDARAGGIYAIGGTPWLGGANYVAPTAGPNAETEGNVLGLVAVWTGTVQYVSDEVVLPAGAYTFKFPVYNSVGGTTKPAKGLFGFIAADKEYLAPASAYTVGQWTNDSVKFTLKEATTGKFSVGYTMTNAGSGSAPHLFVGGLTLTYVNLAAGAIKDLQAEIAIAEALTGEYEAGKAELAAAITTAKTLLESSDVDAILAGIETLKATEAAFNKAQTVAANAAKVAGASLENPVDAPFVVNGTFTDNVDGWTCTGGFQNRARANNQDGDFTKPFFENWNPSAKVNKMYQVIENIPNGVYKLKIAAFVNTLADPNESQFVFANNDSVFLTTGSPTFYEVFTKVENNTIEVGLEQTTATANWMGIDNVSLTYFGTEATIEQAKNAGLMKNVAEALAAKQSVKTKAALQTAYDTFVAAATDENKAALEAALAPAKASVNSYKILEAGVLPDNSLEGWTCTNTNTFHINTWSNEGNSDGSGMQTPFIENWVGRENILGTGEIYYSLPGLDPGVYKFSALIRAYSEAGNAPTGASLFAGNREKEFATGKNFEFNGMKGIYDNYAMACEVGEDGIFKFGIKIAEERNFNWMAFKNCKVSYVGAAIDSAAIADLAKTMPEGKLNAKVKAAADSIIAAAKANINLDNYEAAAKAIAEANASAAAYVKMKSVLDFVAEEVAKTNVYTAAAKEKFDSIYAASLKSYNEGTISDADANAFNYGNRLTGLIPELFLSAYTSTVEGTPYINTWSIEGDNDGSNFKVPFYEYWTGDENSLAANVITAKVEGVEPGDYEVSAWVRVRIKNGAEAPATSITLNAGNDNVTIAGTQIGTSPLYAGEYKVNATVAENGILTFDFRVEADGNVSWLSFKNVKFEKKSVDPNDFTAYIVNADLKGEGGFDATGTKGIDKSGIVKAGNNAQFDFKQTIANLPAGKYKVTAQAAYRYSGSEADEAAAIAAGTETKFAKLYAIVGKDSIATLVQNRYDGASETDFANGNGSTTVNEKFVPNSSSAVQAWFSAGQYVNEIEFNLPADGAVTIGISKYAQPEAGDYTVIGPWTLTRLGDAEVEPVGVTVTYALNEGDTFKSGQTVEVKDAKEEVVATITYGETGEGAADFSAAAANSSVTGFTAFTAGNGVNGNKPMGTFYTITPKMDGKIEVAVVLNADKAFYVEEDGTALEAYNGIKEAEKYYGTYAFNVKADKAYKFYCSGSKLGFYGFNYTYAPKETPQPVDSALIAAKDALLAVIAADKTIQTEGQQGADALTTAIATAEGAANAADATVESIAAARAALAAAVATFTKANIGADFAEIPQDQGKDINDGATRASVVEGEGYTQYTTDGGVCVIIKKYDVDVKNCDYVTVKFAEPLPNGICAAFWAQSGTANVGMPAGAYEYKYVFADDAQCAIANGIMPQLTLLTLWNSQTVKVVGVYKHYTEDYMTSINTLKTQRENGAIYNLNGQKVNKAQKGLYIINGKRVVVK